MSKKECSVDALLLDIAQKTGSMVSVRINLLGSIDFEKVSFPESLDVQQATKEWLKLQAKPDADESAYGLLIAYDATTGNKLGNIILKSKDPKHGGKYAGRFFNGYHVSGEWTY